MASAPATTGAATTLALPATLTLAQARQQTGVLEEALGRHSGAAVIIDASALQAFDTSAIAVLLEAQRLARAAGHTLSVSGAPSSMVDLAQLYGVAELLSFEAAPA